MAHLLDDEADHLRRGDDAVGGGRVRAQGPGRALHPVLRRHARVDTAAPRSSRSPCRRSSRCASGTCSRTPPGSPTASTTRTPVDAAVPRGRVRVGRAGRAGPRAASATRGPGCRCCSSPGASGTTPWPPTCSAASSRSPPASRSTQFFAERIFGPLGMTDTALRAAPTATPSASPRSTRPTRRRGMAVAQRRARAGGVSAARVPLRRRRPGLDRRRLPPLHADAARGGGELDGVRLLGPAHRRAT